jgi:hypothetical protein
LSSNEFNSELIAISLVNLEQMASIGPDGRVSQRAVLRAESRNPNLSFTFTTGLLYPDQLARCEARRLHGSTIVEAPESSRFGYSAVEWQHEAIRRALQQVESLFHENAGRSMSAYDDHLAAHALELLNKQFPRRLNWAELKYQLRPEPSDDALRIVIEGLLTEGLIEVHAMRDGVRNEIVDVAWVKLSGVGRSRFTNPPQNQSPIVHGDHIVNYGQAGAIGRHSQGIVNAQRWEQIRDEIDLPKLATELELLRTEYRKVAQSREDDKQIALLADATDEAERGNGTGVLQILSNAGPSVLKNGKGLGNRCCRKTDCGVDEGLKLGMKCDKALASLTKMRYFVRCPVGTSASCNTLAVASGALPIGTPLRCENARPG